MGKVRRYKKKLAKVASGTNDAGENEQTDYLELAEELLSLRKDDDKMSVCSVMKSVKSSGGSESLKLKKEAKRYLKHAFLLKRLQKTQKSLKKKNNKSDKSLSDNSDDDDDDDNDLNANNQKVLDWPVGKSNNRETQGVPAKKHRKGHQKKRNAQMAKDLVSFSKKIKRQLKKTI